MFATLTAVPTVIGTRRSPPVLTARWLGPRRPRRHHRSERIRLCPGVWIIREQQWLPVSALDSATSVPEPDVPPAVHVGYSPPEWMSRGLCAQLPPEQSDPLFFGVDGRAAPGGLITAANTARRICAGCPVQVTCLTNALVNDERYGVWAGTSGRQREKLRLRLVGGAAVDDLIGECLPDRVPA